MEIAVSVFYSFLEVLLITGCSEEEEPDDYPFPLTLKTKKSSDPNSPAPLIGGLNGIS